MKVALIDYGAGNLASVRKALCEVGCDVVTCAGKADLYDVSGIVVPGVGHFESTRAITEDLRHAILRRVEAGVPLLGICLGMQWLLEGSAEAPAVAGLGLVAGRCVRMDVDRPLKVPHVGWNSLRLTGEGRLMDDVPDGSQVYFTHSFAVPVTEDCVATATHGVEFAAAVERQNVFGVQFHPEKSGTVGLRILRNFVAIAKGQRVNAVSEPRERPAFAPKALRRVRRSFSGGGSGAWGPREQACEGVRGMSPPVRSDVLSKRIIACLDVRDGSVVKGVNFEGLRRAGDPAELALRYNAEEIDELVLLDVTATVEGRRALADTVLAVARHLFIPLTVGGGMRTEDDAAAAMDAGADKVSLNTAAIADPSLISRLAGRYGSQAVIVAIDAKRNVDRWTVFARSGQAQTAHDAVMWAREAEAHGAGEILLTSIDRDGTRAGFDCDLTAAVASGVSIPVIASGGAGTFQHFHDVFTHGSADAALAASVFHYSEHAVHDLKAYLADNGIPVRRIDQSIRTG